VALTLGTGARATANPIITFNLCNTPGLCNAISLTAKLDAGSVDISVKGLANFGIFGDSGNDRAFGFNVNDPGAITISNLTPGFSFGGTDKRFGPYGIFDFAINGPHTGAGAILPLAFTVSRTGGFGSLADFFAMNSGGFFFAAHVRNNLTGVTGFDSTDRNPVVPEPTSLVLLATGAAAVLSRTRARRSKV
jgi:hypothetical protein